MFSITSAFERETLEKQCERVLCDEIKNDLLEDIKRVKEDKKISSHQKDKEINKLIFKAILLSMSTGYGSACYNYDKLVSLEQEIKNIYTKGFIDKKAEIEFLRKKLNIKPIEN